MNPYKCPTYILYWEQCFLIYLITMYVYEYILDLTILTELPVNTVYKGSGSDSSLSVLLVSVDGQTTVLWSGPWSAQTEYCV